MLVKKISLSLSACVLSFLISFSAAGDDLEIYLGTNSSEVTYKPNVLFIMDTSGSMSGRDDGDTTRMQRVQDALTNALNNATNINAGLMRFSDWGGPILYPIQDIDAPVSPEIIVTVQDNDDDAFERDSQVFNDSDYLVHSDNTSTVYTGLRFQDLHIPQGAVITSAKLKFRSAGENTSATNFIIKAQDSGDSISFGDNNNDISSRTATSAEVLWSQDTEWPTWTEVVSTPDLSAVVQEVVDRGDWCGGNNLTLILESTDMEAGSYRRSYAEDEGSNSSPQLLITYDESSATGCIRDEFVYQIDNQNDNAEERSNGYESTGTELTLRDSNNSYVGLRFQDVALPQGADIINAYLEFTAYTNYNDSGAQMTIRGANRDDTENFNDYDRYMLRDMPKTSASVSWTSIDSWSRNGEYESPSITAIIKEIVDRPGWELNNNITIILSDFNNAKRGGYTYNGLPSGAARLVLEFQGNATPETVSTVRQHLISKVDELSTSGFTPIVDTLYEASLYFGGRDVDYGLARGVSSTSSSVRKATRVSHRASYVGQDPIRPSGCSEDDLGDSDCIEEVIPSGATYISPVEDLQCQTNNHIVLLSDGQANYNHSVSKIEAFLGESCASADGGEKCGLDLVANISDAGDSVIDARVVTHTIGFAANSTANSFLNQLALQSGGGFYQADDSDNLLEAFETILRQVKDVNTTFVSPGVAVNQLNRLAHRDELYFALFKPAEGTLWPGNLKKYKIDGDTILDQNGLAAVDESTGFFTENSQSYWSTLTDGNDVREGGAISKLDLVRDVYFFEDTPGSILTSGNEVDENNTNISTEDMGTHVLADPDTSRTQILKWARGVDVLDDDGDGSTTDVRYQMGDPIHSQPIIVNYSDSDSAIFVATNHGFLHSIDAEDGSENFAVIPKELLSNLYEFYRDSSSYNHQYGIDGDLVIRYVEDQIYLYVGMRRGGNNYYVFNVTNKTNPKLVFTVNGGEGDFANMGQTWSRPILTQVNIGGTVKNVMIVGGGYDELQDDKDIRSEDTVGNSVYMIDADNGQLLWSASTENADYIVDEMKYSIPARISTVDRNKDGLADHMYVADTGGQLFRLDIYNGQAASSLVRGGLLGSFGGDTAEDNRRFYYGPDVSEIILGEEQYYAVAIGSGFRAGPLNTTINDHFYMIKDKGAFLTDDSGYFTLPDSAYTADDLYNATSHALTSSDETVREIASQEFANKHGWILDLQSGGEKVLSSPLILDYQVFFTTYLPASASDSLCAPPSGNSRAYLVNLLNANSVADINNNNTDEHEDRYAQLAQTGIAPDTKILIENIVQPVVCLGAECVSAVIEVDENGNEVACGTDFECLAQNIYGRFERVQKDIWKTEIEKP